MYGIAVAHDATWPMIREDFHHSMEQFLLSQSKLGKFGTRNYTCPLCHPWMYENHSTPAYEQFIKAD